MSVPLSACFLILTSHLSPHTVSPRCLTALPHRTASLSAGTDNEETFNVETVLEHRRAGRTWEFLIKWEGFAVKTTPPGSHAQTSHTTQC